MNHAVFEQKANKNLAVIANAPLALRRSRADHLLNKCHIACYMMRHGESKDTQIKPAHLDITPGMQ